MTKLKEGTKNDGGKTRMDLFPPEAFDGISQILTMGAAKYEDHNWRKGIKYSRVLGALFRHLWAWIRGEAFDLESGLPHLWHAGCNIAFLIAYEADQNKYAKFRDIYHHQEFMNKEEEEEKELSPGAIFRVGDCVKVKEGMPGFGSSFQIQQCKYFASEFHYTGYTTSWYPEGHLELDND